MMPTLGSKAYEELRRMLVRGQLEPGMQLVNRKLADEIGMSMTPVREAVTRLASEGLVEHVPGAGAFVRRATRHELAQLYDVREALEPVAAAQAAAHATPADLAELRAIAAHSFAIIRSIATMPSGHADADLMAAWLDDEQRFHEVLFEASHNRWLSKIAADMKLLAFGFSPQRRMPQFLTVASAVDTWRAHRRLIAAVESRDADHAAATALEHVRRGKADVFSHLAVDGGDREQREQPLRGRRPTAAATSRQGGFTLVELLVVIAIIATLVGLLLPAVQSARESARRTQCANNTKQLAVALQQYQASMGAFPAGGNTTNELSWRVFVLPFMEQRPLYDKFDLGAGTFNGGANQEGPNKSVHALNRIPAYQCPSATRTFASDDSSTLLNPTRQTYNSHYYGVSGPKGINPATGQAYPFEPSSGADWGGLCKTGILFNDSNVQPGDIRDGLSNTLLIGEIAIRVINNWAYGNGWEGGGDGGNWVRAGSIPKGSGGSKNVDLAINAMPVSPRINDAPFSSLHAGGGATFARGDGSVGFVSDMIDMVVYKSLCSRKGGETDVNY